MAFPKTTDTLEALKAYAGSAAATAAGMAALCDRLTYEEWDAILERTSELVPLPDDGRKALMLGDGGEGWSILWWDKDGRRVLGKYDGQSAGSTASGGWYATYDEEPHGSED